MSNIITSTVEGVEFDPESITEEVAPVNYLKTALRDLDALLAENEELPRVQAPKLEPTFLHFAYPDKSKEYYFKCNLLSIKLEAERREIIIDSTQSQLLKLFAYWQNSIDPNKVVSTKKEINDIFAHLKLKRKRPSSVREPKANLIRVYTYTGGIKRNLLGGGPHRVIEMQYLVNENKPTLKICV